MKKVYKLGTASTSIINYKNNLQHCVRYSLKRNENCFYEFLEGKLHGVFSTYKNGDRIRMCNYNGGVPHGPRIEKSDDGNNTNYCKFYFGKLYGEFYHCSRIARTVGYASKSILISAKYDKKDRLIQVVYDGHVRVSIFYNKFGDTAIG